MKSFILFLILLVGLLLVSELENLRHDYERVHSLPNIALEK